MEHLEKEVIQLQNAVVLMWNNNAYSASGTIHHAMPLELARKHSRSIDDMFAEEAARISRIVSATPLKPE